MASLILFPLPRDSTLGTALARAIGAELGALCERQFPDGETYLRVESGVGGREAIVVADLSVPNGKALPLLFLADALHDLGAARVGLVAPYLPYMRQDIRFHPGEAITSRSLARLLSGAFDWLVTVDPHLHRLSSLSTIYTIPASAVHAAPAIGAWIGETVAKPYIIGPDAESRQWVEAIAQAAHAPFTVLTKERRGDTEVIESIPRLDEHRDCTPVLVDDIISTGRTMIAAIEHLRLQRASAPVCVAVHAVFANDAYDALVRAGAARVVTTNTIPHRSNAIDVVPIVAAAVLSK